MIEFTANGIQSIIAQGESQTVEFAEAFPGDASIARTLSAFANSDGGIIIVGVNDQGEAIGLSRAELQSTYPILGRLSEAFTPVATYGQAVVGEGTGPHGIVVEFIHVHPAPEHLRPVLTADGTAYRRVGTSNVVLEGSGTTGRIVPAHEGSTMRIFLAMSFRTEEEPALEDYYRAIVRAAHRVSDGIEIVRIDLLEGDHEISQKIMDEIDTVDVIIADFTLNPANVYFELGYARGKGIVAIQTARLPTALEFDVRNWVTKFYRNATQLEEKLVKAIQAAHESWSAKARS